MNYDRRRKSKRNWPGNPMSHASIILPEPMWICCWHSMMNRKIEPQTAYKEQIAARSGGDILLVQRQRFAIAQPQKFLCYPGRLLSARGLGQEPQQAQKPPAFRKGKQVVLSIWVPGGIACKICFSKMSAAYSSRFLSGYVS